MATCWQSLLYFWWEEFAQKHFAVSNVALRLAPSPVTTWPAFVLSTLATKPDSRPFPCDKTNTIYDEIPEVKISINCTWLRKCTELLYRLQHWTQDCSYNLASVFSCSITVTPPTHEKKILWMKLTFKVIHMDRDIRTLKLSVTSLSIRINSKAESGYFCQLFTQSLSN